MRHSLQQYEEALALGRAHRLPEEKMEAMAREYFQLLVETKQEERAAALKEKEVGSLVRSFVRARDEKPRFSLGERRALCLSPWRPSRGLSEQQSCRETMHAEKTTLTRTEAGMAVVPVAPVVLCQELETLPKMRLRLCCTERNSLYWRTSCLLSCQAWKDLIAT